MGDLEKWQKRMADIRVTQIAQLTALAEEWAGRGMPTSATILRYTAEIIGLEAEGYLMVMEGALLNALNRSYSRDKLESSTIDGRTGSSKTHGGRARGSHVLGTDVPGQRRLKARKVVR